MFVFSFSENENIYGLNISGKLFCYVVTGSKRKRQSYPTRYTDVFYGFDITVRNLSSSIIKNALTGMNNLKIN